MSIYLFTFRSKTKPKSEAAERLRHIGGACESCRINFKDYEAAEKLAKLLIRERGWMLKKRTPESKIQKRYLKKKRISNSIRRH
jgi:hypothetical protein